MSDLKHTPGPWSQGKKDSWNRHMSVFAKNPMTDEGCRIIDCNPGFSHDFSEEQKTANARLIAAAPEMLEALESLLSFQVPTPNNYESMSADAFTPLERKIIDAQNKARIAINKATQP